VNEFSVRLWSVIFALGCVAMAGLLAARAGGPWAGMFAASLLLFNSHWVNRTREGLLDSGMMLGMLSGIFLTLSSRSAIAAGLCFAFGCWIKSPMALLGVFVPLACGVPARRVGAVLGVAVIAGLGWYAAQYAMRGGEFVDRYFVYNFITRLSGAVEGHRGDGTYYFVQSWRLAPTALALLAVAFAVSRGGRGPAAPWMLVTLSILLGITLAGSKRDVYLLLVYPFCAIATAVALDRRWMMATVAVVAGFFFARGYAPRLDYTPELKAASLAIREEARPDDVVVCADNPIGVVMFYSQVPAYFTWGRPLEEILATIDRKTGATVYSIARKQAPEGWNVVFQNRAYIVSRDR
jgi:4-amino-4-deoxy-L-arabinose transferase-like glycosyltransferase